MTTVNVSTPSANTADNLVNDIQAASDAYTVVSLGDGAVQVVTTKDPEAALDFLADIIMLQPWYLGSVMGDDFKAALKRTLQLFDGRDEYIEAQVNGNYNSARRWFPTRDPLTLDLDGDGIETIGINANDPILFDHDGDGIKNATGWIHPDDGFLVFDRNGNGTIDNGAELFGDSTPTYAGGQTADGFAALAQEDTNADGIVNAQDAHWAHLRVWQDTNSDGISQAAELKTLEALGIVGLHVAKQENAQPLANGNQIADLGTFIKADGSEGTVGQITGGLADVDLADNPFYREFPDTVPLTAQAHCANGEWRMAA